MRTVESEAKLPSYWNADADKHVSELQPFSHPQAESVENIISYYDGSEARLVTFWNEAIKVQIKDALYSQKLQELKPVDRVKARENAILNIMRIAPGITRSMAESKVDEFLV